MGTNQKVKKEEFKEYLEKHKGSILYYEQIER